MILCGRFSDRFGERRWYLVGGGLVAAVGYVAAGLAPNDVVAFLGGATPVPQGPHGHPPARLMGTLYRYLYSYTNICIKRQMPVMRKPLHFILDRRNPGTRRGYCG
jgi:hypothetical protein